jgi:competence protein ComEA
MAWHAETGKGGRPPMAGDKSLTFPGQILEGVLTCEFAGPVIARRIIEGRPYGSVEELNRVKGIGSKRPEEIRPLVTTE